MFITSISSHEPKTTRMTLGIQLLRKYPRKSLKALDTDVFIERLTIFSLPIVRYTYARLSCEHKSYAVKLRLTYA